MQKSTVLITGGAGFIGSELTRQLAAQGTTIRVVDNLVNGKRQNLDGILCDRVRLTIADVRDIDAMRQIMQGIDVVYHLACLGVRHSIHSPQVNHDVNATATLHLLSIAREAGVRRFVYVSSSEVYGTARQVPMTEAHPTFPATVYGASKLAGESYTRAFYQTYRFPTVIVRPFNAYGPRSHHEGDSGEVIPKFMLRGMAGQPLNIFGDGHQTRDFTYVTDTARGILLAGQVDAAVGETINIGSGREISINQLATEVKQVIGRPDIPIIHQASRPGDVLRLYADGSKAQHLLGFKPEITLAEGLRNLHAWYLSLEEPVESLLADEVVKNWESLQMENAANE